MSLKHPDMNPNLIDEDWVSYQLNVVYEESVSVLCQFVCASFNTTCTLKCLSIGTPKIINFPFVSNGKLMIFRCPIIQTDYSEAVLCLNFGTPENNEFSIWDKWKIYYF